jgi:hypothetical protein
MLKPLEEHMDIAAHQNYLIALKRDVQAAWITACEADGIDPASKFVVFGNTTEAANYNELMGLYLRAIRAYRAQVKRNQARRDRHAVLTGLGLKRVKGALGGTYYE